jgi:hypothetical protein
MPTNKEINEWLALNVTFTINKGCRSIHSPLIDGIISGFTSRADCENYIRAVAPDYCGNASYCLSDKDNSLVAKMASRGKYLKMEVIPAAHGLLYEADFGVPAKFDTASLAIAMSAFRTMASEKFEQGRSK